MGILSQSRRLYAALGKEVVKRGAQQGITKIPTTAAVRRNSLDKLGWLLGQGVGEADYLPGVRVDPWRGWLEDAKQILLELTDTIDAAGTYHGRPRSIALRPSERIFKSAIGEHEYAHDLYEMALSTAEKGSWRKAVETYGTHPRWYKGGYEDYWRDWARKGLERRQQSPGLLQDLHALVSGEYTISASRPLAEQLVEKSRLTESLSMTLQDILRRDQPIEAPIGLLREIEKMFNAPGLIDLIAHRLRVATV